MELLLKAGADPNAVDHIGSSALAWVVKNGNLRGIELLAEAGANPNHGPGEDPAAGHYDGSREMEGITPLVHAVDRAITLMESGGEQEKTIAAVEVVQTLLDMGAEPKGSIPEGSGGRTPLLIEAAASGSLDVVKALLAAGAAPNLRDKEGRTPLFYAVEKNNKTIAEMLIHRGADVHAKDKTGKSILIHAIDRRRGEILELLINNGITIEEAAKAVAGDGETALFAAVWESRVLLAKKLSAMPVPR